MWISLQVMCLLELISWIEKAVFLRSSSADLGFVCSYCKPVWLCISFFIHCVNALQDHAQGLSWGWGKAPQARTASAFQQRGKWQARFVGFNILVWETEETEEILHLKCIQHLQTGTQNRALYPSTMFAGCWVLNVNAHVHIPQFQTSPAASSPLRSPCLTPFLSPKLQYSVLPDSSCGPHPCISAGEFMCCFCLWSSQKLHWLPCPHSCSAHWGQNPTKHTGQNSFIRLVHLLPLQYCKVLVWFFQGMIATDSKREDLKVALKYIFPPIIQEFQDPTGRSRDHPALIVADPTLSRRLG